MPAFDPIAFARRAWKDAPWLTIAVTLHAVVLAGMLIWVIGEEQVVEEVPPIAVSVKPAASTPVDPPPPPPPIRRNEIPPDEEAEVVEHDRDLFHDEPFFERDWTEEVGDPEGMDDTEQSRSSTAVGAGDGGQRGRAHTTKFVSRGVGDDR